MTDMKLNELVNKNKCPAEYVNEVEGQSVPYDCEACGYDCRKCVEEFIDEYK